MERTHWATDGYSGVPGRQAGRQALKRSPSPSTANPGALKDEIQKPEVGKHACSSHELLVCRPSPGRSGVSEFGLLFRTCRGWKRGRMTDPKQHTQVSALSFLSRQEWFV